MRSSPASPRAHGLQVLIDDADFSVGDGTTDCDALAIVLNRNLIDAHDACRFGLAKHVHVPRRVLKVFRPRARNVRL